MDANSLRKELRELQAELATLPMGYISRKKINGNVKYYLQWTEAGKKKSKYIDEAIVDDLNAQIEHRREIQLRIKTIQALLPKEHKKKNTVSFRTNVMVGDSLRAFAEVVAKYKKRYCISMLTDYLYNDVADKVFILFGLRRTGKTTLMRQAIGAMNDSDFQKTAFLQISSKNTLADVNADMKQLRSDGYRYVFVDEATLMEDFVEGAALFSDIFASTGMKIVLSGTDSLGFLFSEDTQLFDRCILLHTTFIPYREFEDVLGIHGIDEYIRYGGTMSLGGVHYNENSPFATKQKTDSYVDSAIAQNIQHSLECYRQAGHFRALRELYDRDELTNAINRVIEDYNHSFSLEVLTREFISHDLGQSAANLRRDRNNPTDILDRIDKEAFTRRLKELLEIKNKSEQTVSITNAHRMQIKEYLDLLDLTMDIPIQSLPVSEIEYRTVFTQPGIRYSQAEALVKSLMADKIFATLSAEDRACVVERILDEIKGRMLEDIVLLETTLAKKKQSVFKLEFAVGEFDMVIADEKNATCEIFEVKHSTVQTPEQYKNLVDAEKCKATAFRYGNITRRVVLYRGVSSMAGDIEYINVEEFLRSL